MKEGPHISLLHKSSGVPFCKESEWNFLADYYSLESSGHNGTPGFGVGLTFMWQMTGHPQASDMLFSSTCPRHPDRLHSPTDQIIWSERPRNQDSFRLD
ncbi:hypothetical protein BV898_16935 [Hypsibius exemplaris]|uniref:Uncharacterized protein n=1 Tax=Hypsibius exemplaris TaxID=2072580 RepID=A0A9X6NE36_HYPEX|nr:hypothetical protein BV898_16935 [Hypsibius exemplaris]